MPSPDTCRLASMGERMAAHQAIVHDFDAPAIRTSSFGLDEQLALMTSLHESPALSPIAGRARAQNFGHEGQAIIATSPG